MKKTVICLALLVSGGSVFAQDAGVESWNKIHAVLSHPRCASCHTPDNRPRWYDEATKAYNVHAMNVQRGADGFGNTGLRCTTCHQAQNSAAVGGPPGAPAWHLPPVEMAWVGKTSSEICAQFKDPTKTGGRDIAAMAEHVKKDALVGWGWAPGEGREAAPGSVEELYQAILAWQTAGAPCPTP
jgi:hypothetical protein